MLGFVTLKSCSEHPDGSLLMDESLEQDLHNMIRVSCNACATRVLDRIGREKLLEVLESPDYHFYDRENGGGLWVGKPYGPESAYRRDPLEQMSHGATVFQAARFYYGVMNGTIIDTKYLSELEEIFGSPAIKHKFVKGLQGRKDVEIYRKSGTWRTYHADSAVVASDDLVYIVVYIDNHPDAGRGAVDGIKIVDDVMLKHANRKR